MNDYTENNNRIPGESSQVPDATVTDSVRCVPGPAIHDLPHNSHRRRFFATRFSRVILRCLLGLVIAVLIFYFYLFLTA